MVIVPKNQQSIAKVVHHKSKLPDKFYYGSTSRQFKKRYYGHVQSFKNENSNPTGLSKYVWKLKNSGWKMDSDFKIKWSILTKAYAFSLGGKKCDLCLTEKTTIILHKDQNTLLNRRDEILTKCRHKEAHCLSSVKQQQPPTYCKKHVGEQNVHFFNYDKVLKL